MLVSGAVATGEKRQKEDPGEGNRVNSKALGKKDLFQHSMVQKVATAYK